MATLLKFKINNSVLLNDWTLLHFDQLSIKENLRPKLFEIQKYPNDDYHFYLIGQDDKYVSFINKKINMTSQPGSLFYIFEDAIITSNDEKDYALTYDITSKKVILSEYAPDNSDNSDNSNQIVYPINLSLYLLKRNPTSDFLTDYFNLILVYHKAKESILINKNNCELLSNINNLGLRIYSNLFIYKDTFAISNHILNDNSLLNLTNLGITLGYLDYKNYYLKDKAVYIIEIFETSKNIPIIFQYCATCSREEILEYYSPKINKYNEYLSLYDSSLNVVIQIEEIHKEQNNRNNQNDSFSTYFSGQTSKDQISPLATSFTNNVYFPEVKNEKDIFGNFNSKINSFDISKKLRDSDDESVNSDDESVNSDSFKINKSESSQITYHMIEGDDSDDDSDYDLPIISKGKQVIINDYEMIKILGQGAFGITYEAIDKNSLQHVAVKKIKKLSDDEYEEAINLEKLGTHCNDYFSCFIESIDTPSFLYVVMEYLGDYIPLDVLMKDNFFSVGFEINDMDIMKQFNQVSNNLCRGLKLMHSLGIAHQDIKPENILINMTGNSKIKYIDFGLSCYDKKCNDSYIKGTLQYIDPLMFLRVKNNISFIDAIFGKQYLIQSQQSDLWSLGCVIYQMITGETPYSIYLIQIYGTNTKAIKNIMGLGSHAGDFNEYIKNYSFIEDPFADQITDFLTRIPESQISLYTLLTREKRTYFI